MDKLKTWSEVIGIWITIIGAFIGAIFVLNEYLEKSKGERVKVTLEYVERFTNDPLQSARMDIENAWFPETKKLFYLADAGEEKKEELKAFIIDFIRNNKLENETDLVISFFDSLGTCACANLCDEDTIRQFFGKYALKFYGLNFPYIEWQRQELRDDSYGAALALLAIADSLCKAKY